MTSNGNEALDSMLAKLDAEACIKFFKDVTEKDRKAHSARVLLWYDICRLHHLEDGELRFWMPTLIGKPLQGLMGEPPKRIQKLWKQVQEAKATAKQMPPQVVKKEAMLVSQLAIFATSTLTEIKKRNLLSSPDLTYKVLQDRSPKFLPEWCEWVCEEWPQGYWPIIRRMEDEGLFQPELKSNYLIALALCTTADELRTSSQLRERIWSMPGDDTTMRRFMMSIPFPSGRGAFEDPNWFQNFQQQQQMAPKWHALFLELCAEAVLDRVRLVSELMQVFVRFNLEHSDSKSNLNIEWFQSLHDQVELTKAEKLTFVPDYLRLLSCRNPKVISWALKSMSALVAEPEFPLDAVCESIPVVFLLKGKEHSADALKLLKEIADNRRDLVKQAAYATAEALSSESQEIQKRALVQLEKLKYKDDDLCDIVRSRVDSIGAVHRERALTWSGGAVESFAVEETPSNVVSLRPAAKPQFDRQIPMQFRELLQVDALKEQLDVASGALSIPELQFRGDEFPRLLPANTLPVLKDLDELIFTCSQFLHGQWNDKFTADQIEVLLDALSRFGSQRPPDFAASTQAIKVEASKRAIGWVDPVITGICTWLTGQNPLIAGLRFPDNATSLEAELQQRFVYVSERAHKGKSTLLLSTPSHKGGWIDPLVLVDRLCAVHAKGQSTAPGVKSIFQGLLSSIGVGTTAPPELADQCLAILRLAPDRRKVALQKLDASGVTKTEFTEALRYALGADGVRIGDTLRLWVAAARSRSPFGNDSAVEAKFPNTGPDGASLARYNIHFTNEAPPKKAKLGFTFDTESTFRLLVTAPPQPAERLLPGVFTVQRHRFKIQAYSSTRFNDWDRSIWPINQDAFYSHCVERLVSHDGNDSSGREQTVFLEALYDPDVPVTKLAMLMLALGTCSKQKDEHATAVEALMASIDDGRINGRKLGSLMYELMSGNALRKKAGYWNQDYSPLVSITRWAKALKPVAVQGAYHAFVTSEILQELLRGDAANAPRDVSQLLEILLECLMANEDIVERHECRAYLEALLAKQPNAKAGKISKQILNLKRGSRHQVQRAEILQYALERRADRADRWETAQTVVDGCKIP